MKNLISLFVPIVFGLAGINVLAQAPTSIEEAIVVECPAGTSLAQFMLEPISPDPQIFGSDVGGPAATNYFVLSPANGLNLRLDLCVNDTDPSVMDLAQVVHRPHPFSPELGYQPGDSAFVEGLAAAVLEHDVSQLKIELIHQESGIRIRGINRGGQSFVAAVGIFDNGNGVFGPDSSRIMVGKLVLGNPWDHSRCEGITTETSGSFTIGTATFDARFCKGPGAGHSTRYKYLSLMITDTNEALSPEARQPVRLDTPEKIDAVMTYTVNHHNACDSFYIKLPHAEYAATSAPAAGCGPIVVGAPFRDFTDRNPHTLYSIRYRGGALQTGEVPCDHYLFCGR